MMLSLRCLFLDLLEKAFAAEVASINGGLGIIQTKSKIADKLVEEGYLTRRTIKFGGRLPTTAEGLALTIKGNMTYCMSCSQLPEEDE